jgi:hypothetical protein
MKIGINSRDRTYPSMIRTKTVKVTFRLSPGLLPRASPPGFSVCPPGFSGVNLDRGHGALIT